MDMRRSHPAEMSSFVLDPALSDSPDGGISTKYALTQIKGEEERLLVDRNTEAEAARHKATA